MEETVATQTVKNDRLMQLNKDHSGHGDGAGGVAGEL